MAETILTPGKGNNSNIEQIPTVKPNYLLKDKFLSEFSTEAEKSVVRTNLGVLPAEDVYTKEEIEPVIIDKITRKFAEHLDSEEHITESEVLNMLIGFVHDDGSTPFTAPQSGKNPTSDSHLTTKIYVDKLIAECLKQSDKNRILLEVANILRDYVKQEDVYSKEELYTQDKIDNKFTKYVKLDGTTPFEAPQSGRTPKIGSHLTTKTYVDTLLKAHKEDIDPHGFTEKLANKLKKYALKDNVYDRTQTYSRGQIDQIIDKLVEQAVEEALEKHLSLEDPHNILNKILDFGYVTKDGTVGFTNPQKGVDAVNKSDLVTLRQLLDVESKLNEKIDKEIDSIPEPIWITTGPVKADVGLVEAETEFAKKVTLQQIMDAIFYGKGISISAPPVGRLGQTVPVTVCAQGSLATLAYGELYQNGKLIATLHREQFEEQSCITIDSEPIKEDTEFVFKVTYISGATHTVSATVKLTLPVFIGLLPKWQFGNVLTYDDLLNFYSEDPENNWFYDYPQYTFEAPHKYNFKDAKLKHPFMAIPHNYPELYQMQTPSQQFGIEAFDVIDMIPFKVPGADADIIYTLYIYKEALSQLNIPVTFKFKQE